MPRKVNYGLDDNDYDDGYDYDYDDYDEEYVEYEDNVQETAKPHETPKGTGKTGDWRCSICTYDNDDRLLACDICGVIRASVVNGSYNNNKNTVENICKVSGVSKMAKSLFASVPNRATKMVNVSQQKIDDLLKEEVTRVHLPFSSHSRSIEPFKFDVPSPDDMVSNGVRSFKKANFPEIKSSGVSSTKKNKAAATEESSSRNVDSSINTLSKRKEDVTGKSYAKNKHGNIKPAEAMVESSVASMPKRRYEMEDDNNSSSTNTVELQNLANDIKKVSFTAESGNSSKIKAGKAKAGEYKPEAWMLQDEAPGALTQLNLAIVGHVDSGKSTLSGRLLHLLGRITQKVMHKYEKESKSQGKGSFAYAWAMDESAEERERGITMTVAVAYFDSEKYHVVILDSPGHKDFVPNMISGATQADAAILVIDASVGAFEAGMDSNKGQTREHAQLIRSFGVDQIIVAVNKMDVVQYSEERFDLIKQQLGTFLRSCRFKDSSITFVPLSVMENQNLVSTPSDVRFLSWYRGPYLLEAIDSFKPPVREFSKSVLMPICDVVRTSSQGQVSACGKLESGALRSGSKVLIMPSREIGTVRSLERDTKPSPIARAGDNVSVVLQGIDGSNLMAGGVLCHPDFPIAVSKHVELKVLILEGATPILMGSQLEFHVHHVNEAATVVKILSLLDPKTGNVMKKSPRCLIAKQSAVIEVMLEESVCVAEFSRSKALGRVFLRALGRTVAVGVVTRVIDGSTS